jgi:hypothetical protein
MSANDRIAPLHSRKILTFLLLCGVGCLGVSCGKSQAYAPVDMDMVMQAVRSYGQVRQTAETATAGKAKAGAPEPSTETSEDSTNYQNRIAVIMSEDHFDQLEMAAQSARTSNTVYPGDILQLAIFYEAVSKPPARDNSSDSDWKTHFATLRKWVAGYPGSATAHTATAEAYINYAWEARGDGYSNTVNDRSQKLFEERIGSAESVLVEAAKLKEKCPEWYVVMFNAALAQGWDKKQARELLDQAVAFAPGYRTYYNEYANFVLPKWHGEEGETQAFAEEVWKKVGGTDGSILYYEIAGLLACQCDPGRNSIEGLSWPKIKLGYEDLKNTYGVTNLSKNRIAYMAFSAGDKQVAQQAFQAVGNDWNHSVWNSVQSFESARDWAVSP